MPNENRSFAGKVAFVTGAANRHRPRRGAGFRARGRQCRAGWDEMLQIREEVGFTKGRIIVRGKLVTRCVYRKPYPH
jgi:hypothetical protein